MPAATGCKASDGRSLFVIGSDGGLLGQPVEVNELTLHAGERFELMVDCRSGKPFDLVALPEGEAVMRLPPFDAPLRLLTIRPVGADGKGKLPDGAWRSCLIAGRTARRESGAGHEHVPATRPA